MIIEKATPSDLQTLVTFQAEMALETEELKLSRDKLTAGITALFDDPSKGSYFVARENQTTMGCLMITYEWSDWRNGTVLWIQSVYVAPEFRGKGIYRKLYEYIQEMVRNRGDLAGIRLYVDQSNHSAQKVYERLGMNGDHYQLYEWMK